MKKRSYLFLALLLPGLIFVFLKYAGSNQFDIPVYYEKGVKNTPADCAVSGDLPYTLPDSLWHAWGIKRKGANVITFSAAGLDHAARITGAISKELAADELQFLEASSVSMDSVSVQRWRDCVFFLQNPWQTVLFDNAGRIRGYYDLRSRDEVDRLRVELKILLNHY